MKRLELTTTITDINVRQSGDGSDTFTVRGHAAVFGRLSENLGGFRERIAPGAFSRILDSAPDVRLLFNHDGLPLARTTAQTLELREDPQGLHVWARLDARRTDAADLRYALERGDVSQMSFAFRVSPEHDVRDGEDDEGTPIYEVREVSDLLDASIVSYPAYPQTDVSLVRMRMLDEPQEIARHRQDADGERENSPATDTLAAEDMQDREFEFRRRKTASVTRARLLVARDLPTLYRWDGSASRYSDSEWKAACILDRGGDGTAKERYGLPVANPGNSWSSHPDAGGVHAAAARINQVSAPSAAKHQAYERLVSCYHKLGETPPDSVTNGAK